MRRGLLAVLIGTSLLAACGSDDEARPDASSMTDAGIEDAGFVIAEPALAALPEWECPAGWTAVEDHGCEPWPVDVAPCAGEAETRFPGSIECTRVGGDCAADGWPTGLPTDVRIVYVRAGAPSGGSGTREAPFPTVAIAMTSARSGDVVALAVGTYPEGINVRAGVTLWGACAETRIAPVGAFVVLGAEGAAVRNLRVVGRVVSNQPVTGSIEDVVLEMGGLAVTGGASVRASRVYVRDSRPGHGVDVQGGAAVQLDRVVIERATQLGIAVYDAGSIVVARDVAVSDTQADAVGYADAIGVTEGGQLTVERAVIDRAGRVGLNAAVNGTVTAADVVVRDTLGTSLGRGVGAVVEPGASLTVRRAAILGSRAVGVGGFGGTLTIEDAFVADSKPGIDVLEGSGVACREGNTATLSRIALTRNTHGALAVSDVGTTMSAVDVTIRETMGPPFDPSSVAGLVVQYGASMTGERITMRGNVSESVYVIDPGSQFVGADVVVEDTTATPLGHFGRALSARDGGRIEVTRARLERNRDASVLGRGAATIVTIRDLIVRDTGPDGEGLFGRAISMGSGAAATIERAVLERSHEIGVAAFAEGTEISLFDVIVSQTLERGCATTTCADDRAGIGIAALDDSHVEATRFTVQDSALAGVTVAAGGEVDLHEGVVRRNVIGANVQTPGFDLARLQDRVVFVDNETNLDAMALPVPEPSADNAFRAAP